MLKKKSFCIISYIQQLIKYIYFFVIVRYCFTRSISFTYGLTKRAKRQPEMRQRMLQVLSSAWVRRFRFPLGYAVMCWFLASNMVWKSGNNIRHDDSRQHTSRARYQLLWSGIVFGVNFICYFRIRMRSFAQRAIRRKIFYGTYEDKNLPSL